MAKTRIICFFGAASLLAVLQLVFLKYGDSFDATRYSHFTPSLTVASESTYSTDSLPKQNQQCLSAALVLFGVPKSFEFIWQAYLENIVERNPHVGFHAYMHMYSDLHQQGFTNERNEEEDIKLESPDDILDILDIGGVSTTLVTSPQSEFDQLELLTWMQSGDEENFGGFSFSTLKNVFRQGNSMKRAYLSASNQTHLAVNIANQEDIGHPQNITRTELKGENENHIQQPIFDVYIFARSDTLLMSPIDIPCSGLGDREIHVGPYQNVTNPMADGVPGRISDRFAVAGPSAASIYAAAKSDVFKEMVLDHRRAKEGKATTLSWATKKENRKLVKSGEDAEDMAGGCS